MRVQYYYIAAWPGDEFLLPAATAAVAPVDGGDDDNHDEDDDNGEETHNRWQAITSCSSRAPSINASPIISPADPDPLCVKISINRKMEALLNAANERKIIQYAQPLIQKRTRHNFSTI